MSIVARGFKHLDHRPLTMRTSVNDSKYCLDDRYGIVYVLTKYVRLPRVLDSWVVYVGDYGLNAYKVKSIVWKTNSCKSFMDIPVRIKVLFFY